MTRPSEALGLPRSNSERKRVLRPVVEYTVSRVSPCRLRSPRASRPSASGDRPEYWIVDPRTETLTVLALHGAAYVEHGAFPRGARAASAAFDGLTVDVGAVFDAAA